MENTEYTENKNAKKYNPKTIKRLLKYAEPYVGWFLLAIVIIIAIVGLELYQPLILGDATTVIEENAKVVNPDAAKQVIGLGVKYFGVILLTLILTYFQALILAYIGQKIIYNIRLDIFKHIHTLSINFFNNNPIGRLVTRVTNDVETLNEMYTSVIVNILKSSCSLIGIIAIMLMKNIKLSLLTFTVIPFIIIFTTIFSKLSRKTYREIRNKISAINAFVSEHVSGMKIVQIFAVENKMLQKFKQKSEELRKNHFKQITIFAVYNPSAYMLKIIATILLFWFGGKMYLAGEISISIIVVFQRYITKFFDPIQEFAEQINIIQSAAASAERIFGLLDEEPDIVDEPDAIELDDIKGEIEFKNVWFAYNDDEWILKDVSFKVKPGQNVAFVGATGAGKTTIQNLISRYYDIQKGEILIDGINIKHIKVDSLRTKIGQMLQDVFLFTGDVKSNIRLRNEKISDEEIIEAAKYVNADNFISKFRKKYDEPVIERGASFSAGQRQLLSFARTLAYKPKILILDEATANIDTETESLIQDALNKIMKGRTTLVVAHRLSTIQNADNIIVMHKGRIVEQGSHQQLLSNHGMYYKLYKLQYEH